MVSLSYLICYYYHAFAGGSFVIFCCLSPEILYKLNTMSHWFLGVSHPYLHMVGRVGGGVGYNFPGRFGVSKNPHCLALLPFLASSSCFVVYIGIIVGNIWSIVLFSHLKPYNSDIDCLDHRKVSVWFTIALSYSESIETF